MRQFHSQILQNAQISRDLFELSLSWDYPAPEPRPGQFLTIRVSPESVPLLRRPFAFASFDAGAKTASVIYQIRGRGTELLSAMRAGEALDVAGPFGAPFPIDSDMRNAVVVAGGVGLGPMLFLSSALRASNIPQEFIFGCRSKPFVPDAKCFRDAGARVCTDDGSAGFAGNAVEYLGQRAAYSVQRASGVDTQSSTITSHPSSADASISIGPGVVVYGCGPAPMLRALCEFCRPLGARVWVSLEAVMACGVGACMGCAVALSGGGYARVCREGPVFDGGGVLWEAM
jgi:dihydroorotate dehydrogenase electron transfer subunit